jgi:hypothetical protein
MEQFSATVHAFGSKAGHRPIPLQDRPSTFGSFDEPLMQDRPPHSESETFRKLRFHRMTLVQETYTGERKSVLAGNLNSETLEKKNGRWQQTLAAHFFDRRLSRVGHHHGKSFVAKLDRSGQARRTCSHHKDVGFLGHLRLLGT